MQQLRWTSEDSGLYQDSSCGNESPSLSDDRAGDSQGGKGEGDKYEPERSVLFARDQGTGNEDHEKEELHLEDLKKDSKKHPLPLE